ncbi:hypothetical protein [Adlercreutzia sp. ZJ154]|uniref:hypothetical protein n=1 Tax=Adlercreutzia sp. ZJ154 TaxID=2709790 RepID=UPI0013ECF45A|nr:hypothetical protein [Adlercreutzia sp. ZJ154]
MKKTSKIFGAVALSAALAVGTVMPAFAAVTGGDIEGSDMSKYNNATKAGITTNVKLKAEITNIDVAVPLNVVVVADSAGGFVSCPSVGGKNEVDGAYKATGYRIENNSSFPVAVTNVKVAMDANATGWTLKPASTDGSTIATVNPTGAVGDLAMSLKPSDAKSASADEADKVAGKNEGNQKKTTDNTAIDLVVDTDGTDVDWMVKAKPADQALPCIMGLEMAGNSTKLNSIADGLKTGQQIFTISYTVSAGAVS